MSTSDMKQPDVTPAVRQRITWTLFTAQSLFSAAQIASFTLLPIIAAQLGGGDSAAGIPPTVTMLGRALAGYPVGWLMDRMGRRFGLVFGYGLAVIGAILSVYAIGWSSFIGFCIGAGLSGMGRGVSEQARFVAAEVALPAERAKVLGWIVFAGTIGAIGGPLLVAPSTEFVQLFGLDPNTGPYAISALLTLGAMVVTHIMLRPDPLDIGRAMEEARNGGKESQPSDEVDYGRSAREIFSSGQVRLALAAMIFGQWVMTFLMVIAPLRMDHHDHGTQSISWMIMAHTLGMFGFASVTGWLVDRLGAVRMIVIGCLIMIFAALLTPISMTLLMMIISMFLVGLGWNFCFIAGSTQLSKVLAPTERGRIQGASETMIALASGIASFSTGFILAQGGMLAVSGIAITMALVPIGATIWFRNRRE